MALQTSGQISIDDLRTEFGVTGQQGLSDFYRGGANVPDIPANSGIPTSGQIALSDFYGGLNGFDFTAEHGVATQPDGTNNSTITLSTPVTVGKSFVLMTCANAQTDNERGSSIFAIALLQTPVNGKYTELYIERQNPGEESKFAYQVIESPDVDVTILDEDFDQATSVAYFDKTISAVDTSKTWLINHCQNQSDDSWNRIVTAEFTSSTNVRYTFGMDQPRLRTVTYLVESDKINVDWYTLTMGSNSASTTITTVDQTKSFIYYTHRNDNNFSRNMQDVAPRVYFSNNTTLSAQRNSTDDTLTMIVQVVTIDGLNSAQATIAGDSELITTVSETNTVSKTFMPSNQIGNCDNDDSQRVSAVWCHIVEASQLKFERLATYNGYQITYFKVTQQQ